MMNLQTSDFYLPTAILGIMSVSFSYAGHTGRYCSSISCYLPSNATIRVPVLKDQSFTLPDSTTSTGDSITPLAVVASASALRISTTFTNIDLRGGSQSDNESYTAVVETSAVTIGTGTSTSTSSSSVKSSESSSRNIFRLDNERYGSYNVSTTGEGSTNTIMPLTVTTPAVIDKPMGHQVAVVKEIKSIASPTSLSISPPSAGPSTTTPDSTSSLFTTPYGMVVSFSNGHAMTSIYMPESASSSEPNLSGQDTENLRSTGTSYVAKLSALSTAAASPLSAPFDFPPSPNTLASHPSSTASLLAETSRTDISRTMTSPSTNISAASSATNTSTPDDSSPFDQTNLLIAIVVRLPPS
ncbi:MAG: hypothetical protein Q9227_001140 [Pyrenula ochraceoflavens]